MPKIIRSESGPISLDAVQPSADAPSPSQLPQWIDGHVSEAWEEFTLQYPNGELKTFRRWFNPRTNKERRETEHALSTLAKMPSLERAVHTKIEQAHHKRGTRALGNRLRGEAVRKKS